MSLRFLPRYMNRRCRVGWSSCALALVFFSALAPSALAQGAFTWSEVSGSVGLDYGRSGDVSPFGVGAAFRGGLTVDNGLYIGGISESFFGESEPIDFGVQSASVWLWAVEFGYDWGLTPELVVRPKVGLGFGFWQWDFELSGDASDDSSDGQSDVAFSIGPQLIYDMAPLQLGLELRYTHLTGPYADKRIGASDDKAAGALMLGVSLGTTLQAIFGKRAEQ